MGPLGPLGPPWAHLGPPWGWNCQALQGWFRSFRKHVQILDFWAFLDQKMVEKKLRLRGLDLSGELRSGILCRRVLLSCKTVYWRPDW